MHSRLDVAAAHVCYSVVTILHRTDTMFVPFRSQATPTACWKVSLSGWFFCFKPAFVTHHLQKIINM